MRCACMYVIDDVMQVKPLSAFLQDKLFGFFFLLVSFLPGLPALAPRYIVWPGRKL